MRPLRELDLALLIGVVGGFARKGYGPPDDPWSIRWSQGFRKWVLRT